jgi:hypothetical protein
MERRVTDLTTSEGIFSVIRDAEDEEHLMRARYADFGDQLLVLRVPEFFFSQTEVEHMIGRARKHQNLIIDLRGNPGGSVDTLRYLVGGIFNKEIKIADRVGRKETKPETAKPLHDPYTGKLVVLVDAESASAAELFARILQLEKRGVVIGDQTSGSVMEAKHYEEKLGVDTVVLFGASITESDLFNVRRKKPRTPGRYSRRHCASNRARHGIRPRSRPGARRGGAGSQDNSRRSRQGFSIRVAAGVT